MPWGTSSRIRTEAVRVYLSKRVDVTKHAIFFSEERKNLEILDSLSPDHYHFPQIFIFGRNGKVAYSHGNSVVSAEDLSGEIEKLLGEKK